jgi:pimeloyl-ACP methyl ester carboxylesterase
MSFAAAMRARAVDGQAIWDTYGPEGAPTIVFLHGTRVTRAMWEPQVRSLAESFRVVTADLPGHGALADVPFRVRDASALAADVIDCAADGKAILVGQSLGGYIAMDAAARHPSRVAGLVLSNCTSEPRTVARTAPRVIGAYIVAAASQRLRSRNGDGAWRPTAGGWDDAPAAGLRQLLPGGGQGTATDQPATHGWLFKGGGRAVVSALRTAFLPRLREYPGPTLIINGANDTVFRRSERDFLAGCADGRLEVVPDAGHLVNSEQPERYNTLVAEFARVVFGIVPDRV